MSSDPATRRRSRRRSDPQDTTGSSSEPEDTDNEDNPSSENETINKNETGSESETSNANTDGSDHGHDGNSSSDVASDSQVVVHPTRRPTPRKTVGATTTIAAAMPETGSNIVAATTPVVLTTDIVTIAATEAATLAVPVPAAAMTGVVNEADMLTAAAPVEATTGVVTIAATDATTVDDAAAVIDQVLDIRMDSPPPLSQQELQGASRTTGGIFRGRAYGNNPNIADFADQDNSLIPHIGKIYLYITANDPATWDFTTMKHRLVIKHNITSSLAKILMEIGDRHSPVRSMF